MFFSLSDPSFLYIIRGAHQPEPEVNVVEEEQIEEDEQHFIKEQHSM